MTALAVVIGLGCFHRPLHEGIRNWRAESLLAEAHEFAEEEQWENARRAATASLQLRSSLEGMRLLLRAYERTRDPNVLILAAGLTRHPDATGDDRRGALRIYLDYGDLLSAAGLLPRLPVEEQEVPATRYQIVRFLLSAGDYARAAEIVDGLPEEERSPDLQLLLAEGFARSGIKEARTATAERLDLALQVGDRGIALRAMRLLAAMPDDWIHQVLAEKIVERFGNDDSLLPADRLRVDLFRLALNQQERESIIDVAVANYWENHPEDLLGWLERLGELKAIAQLTAPGTKAYGASAALFWYRARALESLGRFEELAKELRDPPVALRDVPLQCSRAALATKQGKNAEALLLWKKAMKMAELDPFKNYFYLISDTAKRVGNKDIEMEALARGIEEKLGNPPPASTLPELFGWLYQRDETARLMKISYQLLRREPGNPMLLNNYHYLRVLHGLAGERDLEVLHALVSAFPKQPNFRGSLAFALLKSGNPVEALEVFATLDNEERPKNEQAVRAAALTALRRNSEAAELVARVDWNQFSSAEKRTLKELTKR